jgi:2-polyprenyl-3-methyl-5-hydroxy-6-metoxy-1,4-benzoquinol methylase
MFMNLREILASVESAIKSPDERAYFLIHEARYKTILNHVVRIMNHGKILDVGCYPYHIGKALELMGYTVSGIASEHEKLKQRNVAILNIETDKFPYKTGFFDLVLCSEVIEHLPHSPVPALREMYRVTKPHGHVLVTTPNITRSINQGKMLLGKSPLPPVEEGMSIYHRHNHEYTLEELSKTMSRAGWNVEKATHFVSYTPFRRRNRHDNPLLWTGKFANFLAMKALPRLADTLLVIGKK